MVTLCAREASPQRQAWSVAEQVELETALAMQGSWRKGAIVSTRADGADGAGTSHRARGDPGKSLRQRRGRQGRRQGGQGGRGGYQPSRRQHAWRGHMDGGGEGGGGERDKEGVRGSESGRSRGRTRLYDGKRWRKMG